MPLLHRTHPAPDPETIPAPPDGDHAATTPETTPPAEALPQRAVRGVPRTRAGAAWVALAAAGLLTVALIIFLAQNTRSTEISFLWMTASTPLALALLIAAVGATLLTLVLGTTRITQLRRLIRKRRH
ncbi:lipopolysaccharide assembly protein LapA domain-containing protein [Amycolatopsis anabasis]|uniref:lipopolysaccharide assembly protein LapA domain-containing protein n=1 Tax=Amycolatopsis anabasis TaxID=1840409 RepID=UPI00131B7DC6|nr:lipopolysaccharide assembly protein LapA domain-containing protein [Amycolatopsis anabasis]